MYDLIFPGARRQPSQILRAIPKLRQGSYFSDRLLRYRRRAEQVWSPSGMSYLSGNWCSPARRVLAALPHPLRVTCANLSAKVLESAQPWVAMLVRTVFGQP